MYRSELETRIISWARNKDLLKPENATKQVLKTMSELGELADAILKKNDTETIDAIGDVEVCLTILKSQLGMSLDEPLNHAWEEIKDRTGKTVNGTFIKD